MRAPSGQSEAAVRRPRSQGRVLAVLAALAAVATAAWLLAPRSGITGDSQFAIIWGDQLVHGHRPDISAQWATAPHPLGLLAGAVASVLGVGGSVAFMVAIGFLAFAA